MYRKTVDELQNDQREKLVIDIRSEEDYTKETYPGAKHIFWETFMDHIGEIPKANSAIESVTFPSSLTTIGDFAFADCIQLTSAIVIPDNVVSIGIAAFQNCSQIAKELTIGLKVREIGELAFCNCNVEKVMFRAIFCTIATNAFEGNFITNIVTPMGSTNAYEAYEMFKDIPIEERYDLIEERIPVEWNFKKSTTGEATEGHFLARINHTQ